MPEMTEKAARDRAALVRSRLKTSGWKIAVWKSVEWDYCLVNPKMAIRLFENYLADGYHYHCHFTAFPFDGDADSYSDPNKAIESLVKAARKYIDARNDVVRTAEAWIAKNAADVAAAMERTAIGSIHSTAEAIKALARARKFSFKRRNKPERKTKPKRGRKEHERMSAAPLRP